MCWELTPSIPLSAAFGREYRPRAVLSPKFLAPSSRPLAGRKGSLFLHALRELAGINESDDRRRKPDLYLTAKQLRELKSFDFEIGNHTYTHTHFRSFSRRDFASEIDRNKEELEALSGTDVRSFSQPYGSSKDLTLSWRSSRKLRAPSDLFERKCRQSAKSLICFILTGSIAVPKTIRHCFSKSRCCRAFARYGIGFFQNFARAREHKFIHFISGTNR